ncbi:hypothetical protein ACFLTD_02885 [Elusimicrobiota bacterium]
MPDTFALTVFSLIVFTIVAAFIRGRTRDKCLNSFSGFLINLEQTSGKNIWGKLSVENGGVELVYKTPHIDTDGHHEMSYILYKNEYSLIQTFIRYHDEMDEKQKFEREKELKRTYHPSLLRRSVRKTQNFFKTVKDSLTDAVNLIIGKVKKNTAVGGVLSSQDKYASQIKQELFGSMNNSFEPLLEKHIGNKVIIEIKKADNIIEYLCILKDYTAEFIEVMDVDYIRQDTQHPKKADLVIPRSMARIRHLGE